MDIMESTQPALELASKHMTNLKSINILCKINFTHVFKKIFSVTSNILSSGV